MRRRRKKGKQGNKKGDNRMENFLSHYENITIKVNRLINI